MTSQAGWSLGWLVVLVQIREVLLLFVALVLRGAPDRVTEDLGAAALKW